MPLRTLLAALCAAAICQAPAWAREAPGVAREDVNPRSPARAASARKRTPSAT